MLRFRDSDQMFIVSCGESEKEGTRNHNKRPFRAKSSHVEIARVSKRVCRSSESRRKKIAGFEPVKTDIQQEKI